MIGAVNLHTHVEDVAFDVDTAIPLGLIINELVSNALKYAFPDKRPGELRVTLRGLESGGYELSVADDGVGLPEALDIATASTLGLQLVTALSRQIHGTIDVDRTEGTRFVIDFGGQPDEEQWAD